MQHVYRTAILVLLGLVAVAVGAHAQAIISDGAVQIGVTEGGSLGASGGSPSAGSGTTSVGLRDVATNMEGATAGCICDGWGIAYDGTTSGWCNLSVGGCPGGSLVLSSFTSNATHATSQVRVGDLAITHAYTPSGLSGVYRVDVEVTNEGSSTLGAVEYRRVLDWDAEPTAFSELVTVQGAASVPEVSRFHDNGFAHPDPLDDSSAARMCAENTDLEDCGPGDLGVMVDLDMGSLPPGARSTMVWYLGTAATESDADTAVAAVGADLYSYAQCDTSRDSRCDAGTGTPVTFFLAYGDTVVDLPPQWRDPSPCGATRLQPANDRMALAFSAASSNGSRTVTIDTTMVPRHATFTSWPGNPARAALNWTPTPAQTGWWNLTFSAQDDAARSAPDCTVAVEVVHCGRDPGLCTDTDGDGHVDDRDNCPTAANAGQEDFDGDGSGDACDDSDGDGVTDDADNCRETYNPGQENHNDGPWGDDEGDACDDTDGDRVLDDADNCLWYYNPGQSDTDGDGIGDVCDDSDGDGRFDPYDNCVSVPNRDQSDLDRDGVGDACDPDRDGDGFDNGVDNCPDTSNVDQSDRDGDGLGDACDPVLDADPCDTRVWYDPDISGNDTVYAAGVHLDTECV